jgi:hypothetical protein
MTKPYEPMLCVRGHRVKAVGCVSCELLWQHSALSPEAREAPALPSVDTVNDGESPSLPQKDGA